MNLIRSQNPWAVAGAYGRGLGQIVSKAMLQLPALRSQQQLEQAQANFLGAQMATEPFKQREYAANTALLEQQYNRLSDTEKVQAQIGALTAQLVRAQQTNDPVAERAIGAKMAGLFSSLPPDYQKDTREAMLNMFAGGFSDRSIAELLSLGDVNKQHLILSGGGGAGASAFDREGNVVAQGGGMIGPGEVPILPTGGQTPVYGEPSPIKPSDSAVLTLLSSLLRVGKPDEALGTTQEAADFQDLVGQVKKLLEARIPELKGGAGEGTNAPRFTLPPGTKVYREE